MDDPNWSYEATFVAVPVSVPRARAFVCRHLVEHGVAYLVDPVRLVISELATSAMMCPGSLFDVTLSCADRTVRLAVRDQSPLGRVPAQGRRLDLGGRGLRIVELISSDWGVDVDADGNRTVWASFHQRDHQLN